MRWRARRSPGRWGSASSGGGGNKNSERFQAKWIPVRVKKTRQNKKVSLGFDSITTETALRGEPLCLRRAITAGEIWIFHNSLRPSPQRSRAFIPGFGSTKLVLGLGLDARHQHRQVQPTRQP